MIIVPGTAGAEGISDSPEVNELRTRQHKNLWATLLLSQGIPIINHGDEMGRTQHGNNNVWCQDNELSWVDWTASWSTFPTKNKELLQFSQLVGKLRSEHPVFQRDQFFNGHSFGQNRKDVTWLNPNGSEMTAQAWNNQSAKSIGLMLDGDGVQECDEAGKPIRDDHFVVMTNASHVPVKFTLPEHPDGKQWERVFDTAQHQQTPSKHDAKSIYELTSRSFVVMKMPNAAKK